MASTQIVIPVLLAIAGALAYVSHEDEKEESANRIIAQSRTRLLALPDRTNVQSRLMRIGRENSYDQFRVAQASYSLLSAGITWLISFFLASDFILATLFCGLVGVGAFVLIDWNLTREVKQYRVDIESEFPAIIEMLTLALSAGETPMGAMSRLSVRSNSHLGREFAEVVLQVRQGKAFHVALDDFGRRVDSPVIRRFVDALITAMLRGAPLIDVLQRHAAEARQIQRNFLMDKAGKAEMSMMVPVVFLILPVSILFALWPSVTHLNLFAA